LTNDALNTCRSIHQVGESIAYLACRLFIVGKFTCQWNLRRSKHTAPCTIEPCWDQAWARLPFESK